MPIESGVYTIWNVKQGNTAHLSNSDDGEPIQASSGEDTPSERWEVELHSNGWYSLVSLEHKRFANCGDRAARGMTVEGRSQKQLWILQETRVKGNYTIAPAGGRLFWMLIDGEMGTSVTLHDKQTDQRCWWNFKQSEIIMPVQYVPPSPIQKERPLPLFMKKSILTIASFDAGGLRTLSQLQIMGHILERMRATKYPDDPEKIMLPCENFDMIGGSDTGGLVAIMLTRLQMSVEEATEEFKTIIGKVYPKHLLPASRNDALKHCMEDLLKKRGMSPDLKLEDEELTIPCAGFVLVAPSCLNSGIRVCLRTYSMKNRRPSSITVIEAALATCAFQPHFLPVTVGKGDRKLEFISAGPAASNPARHVIAEAQSLFGVKSSVSSLLSLGPGHPSLVPVDETKGSLHQAMIRMMGDSERVAEEVRRQFGPSGIYFRFSVEQVDGSEAPIEGDEFAQIQAQTVRYVAAEKVEDRVEDYLRNVAAGLGVAPLHQLQRSRNLNLV